MITCDSTGELIPYLFSLITRNLYSLSLMSPFARHLCSVTDEDTRFQTLFRTSNFSTTKFEIGEPASDVDIDHSVLSHWWQNSKTHFSVFEKAEITAIGVHMKEVGKVET